MGSYQVDFEEQYRRAYAKIILAETKKQQDKMMKKRFSKSSRQAEQSDRD